ncbi:MAG: transposase family protein, partial [bacterium]|nr:transposase family protein [bacterium]
MAQKRIPVEALIVLQNHLDALPTRSPQRKALVAETATLYGVSVPTVRRALRKHHQPRAVQRSDYNRPRVTSHAEMKHYCELIAAVKSRSTNRKGRHLSIETCIHLLEEHGVETPEGLVQAPQGLLKRSTVGRYLTRWGYDNRTLSIEPPATRFQAIHSNDCWQFDFSQSDLKKLKTDALGTLMLASVVDDRSGMCYQEYHYAQGEDAMTALRFLFNAMAPKAYKNCPFQGIPGMLYLDNGPVAKSRVFKQVMKHLNVEVRVHIPKGSDGRRTTARSKGKVERVFRTVKESLETLYHFHTPDNLDEANEWL